MIKSDKKNTKNKKLKIIKELAKEGAVMYRFRGEIKSLSENEPKIKVYIATIIETKPIKKDNKFFYKIKNNCMLNDKKGYGGAIDIEIISPKELKEKELISITEGSYHPILGFISLGYSNIEDTIKENIELFNLTSSKGFWGLGEPKMNINGKNLTKEEFVQEQLERCLILNKIVPSELDFDNIKIKKTYCFKNFKLDFTGNKK